MSLSREDLAFFVVPRTWPMIDAHFGAGLPLALLAEQDERGTGFLRWSRAARAWMLTDRGVDHVLEEPTPAATHEPETPTRSEIRPLGGGRFRCRCCSHQHRERIDADAARALQSVGVSEWPASIYTIAGRYGLSARSLERHLEKHVVETAFLFNPLPPSRER